MMGLEDTIKENNAVLNQKVPLMKVPLIMWNNFEKVRWPPEDGYFS